VLKEEFSWISTHPRQYSWDWIRFLVLCPVTSGALSGISLAIIQKD
jgi:hypothetical protein